MCHLGTEENQTYHMLTLIAKHFPKVSQKYSMQVLLPEALITLCCQQLQITFNQAEDLLESGEKREADAFMHKIQQRRKGKFLKKKKALKRKMQEADDKVKFLKQARMDQTSIAKMQRPTFKLNQEDAYRPSNTNGPGTVASPISLYQRAPVSNNWEGKTVCSDAEQLHLSATDRWYSLGLCQ